MRPMINSAHHDSLSGYIHACCEAFSAQPAFIEGDDVLTYGELWARAGRLAGFLREICGISHGDRVAIMLPNVIAFPIASVALQRLGAVQVNINPHYTARELRHQLDDAEATAIIIGSASLLTLTETDPATIATVIVTDLDAQAASHLTTDRMRSFALSTVMDAGLTIPDAAGQSGQDDLAFLQYTGGTTGISKGAMLTHANILANVRQFLVAGNAHFADRPITVLTAIPLYHIFALTVNMFAMFALGAQNILIGNPRNVTGLVDQWSRYKVNFITGVNTLFKGLCADPGFAALSFAPDLLAMGGGSAVQKVVSEQWHALTGRHIREGYGLSETSPILTCTAFEEERFLGSIGKAVVDTDLSIRDADGQPMNPGDAGELCARGPQVMRGYWRRPDATASVMTPDGYFRTGDIARRDADGRYFIVDRQKDMILVSGFNVYPNEVEAVVAEMPGVAECACVGYPDPGTGEVVAIFVVRRQDGLSEEDVRDHCRHNLAAYKIPRRVYFITDMPKTSVGKILRRELRGRLEQEATRGGHGEDAALSRPAERTA